MRCSGSSFLILLTALPAATCFRIKPKAKNKIKQRSAEGDFAKGAHASASAEASSFVHVEQSTSSSFLSSEHKALGDSMHLSNGMKGTDIFTLPTSGHNLTLGDIVMACGDWYGKASQPITDVSDRDQQRQRFLTGPWECLDKDTSNPARVLGYTPCTTCSSFSAPSGCSSYISLANSNYDHFARAEKYSFAEQGGDGAWEAYSAGHAAACETAAGDRSDAGLRKAVMQNACASHFLTDLYAAGHIRQARRVFQCVYSLNCLVSKEFHDEDNLYGLHVTNANGDRWKAFGDGCLNSPANARNKEITLQALTASAEALIAAWNSGSSTSCKADVGTSGLKINVREAQDPERQAQLGNHAMMLIPATGWGCGYPIGPCTGLGDGEITDKYCRDDSCDMTNHTVGNYNWYKSEVTLTKLQTTCPVSSRGQRYGFTKC